MCPLEGQAKMSNLITEQISEYSLDVPQNPIAIMVWVIWLAVIIMITIRNRDRDLKFDRKTLVWLAVLSLSVLLFTPLFGIPLKLDTSESESPKLMVFAALPWLVAGGVLGVLPAVLLAGLSGLLMAYLKSHHVFTPLIFMTAALVFSLCIRQRYRGFIFRCLGFPLIAAFVGALAVIPFQYMALLLESSSEFQTRIVQGMNALPGDVLSYGGTVLIGGFLCIFVKMAAGSAWGTHTSLKPGPGEKSLRFRILAILMPVLVLLSTLLLAIRWISAENEARRDAIQVLTATSRIVSENLSVFIDTGEDLVLKFAADDRLVTQDPGAVSQLLAENMSLLPYFDLLVVLNINGELIAAYPTDAIVCPCSEIMEMVSQNSSVGEIQEFTTTYPDDGGNLAYNTNFITIIRDSSDTNKGILWGQARLDHHFTMIAAVDALSSLSANDGIGQIIGNDGTVNYQAGSQVETGVYTGRRYPTATFIAGQSSNDQSVMQYYWPVGDTGWAVVTSLPIQALQERALEAIYPSAIICIVLISVIFLTILLVLSPVDKNLRKLESAAEAAVSGDFEGSLADDKNPSGVMGTSWDSVSNLITSLQKYHSKRSDLLTLNKQLSDQLSLNDSLKIILLAALERGLSSARILITDGASQSEPVMPLYRIGLGEHTHALALLDEDILALTRERGELVLRDFQIGKLVNVRKEMPYPASVIALPLVWKGSEVGIFWGTFHNGRHPEGNDFSFFKDLSKKAALAVIEAQEAGEFIEPHAQLEVVLEALNDPVLISDNYGRIVFLNKAAESLLEGGKGGYAGSMLSNVFHNETLLSLFQEEEGQSRSMEMQFSDGKTYQVIAQPTPIGDQQMGVVALFKDVTSYKTKDALQNEFVMTTSHELRSPLTLINGYAKILRLTGNMNEQQDKYVQNIIESVEGMRNLVQNLLSLGRLEAGDALALQEITTDEIVQNVLEGLEAQADQKNIRLETATPKSHIRFEADAALLKLALRNLVDNAIKFTKMGGDVTLSVRRQGNSVIFEVQDTGIGIAPLDQRHIFDKFHRVSLGGDEKQQGSGLGLAIVKFIAEHHRGKVWLESQLGNGSTFYLQLPIKQS
jgi:signal transduction histidine kinase